MYKLIFEKIDPPKKVDMRNLVDYLIKIQKMWRGSMARKYYKSLQDKKLLSNDVSLVKDQLAGITKRNNKASPIKDKPVGK